jgi:hypothetical protein
LASRLSRESTRLQDQARKVTRSTKESNCKKVSSELEKKLLSEKLKMS